MTARFEAAIATPNSDKASYELVLDRLMAMEPAQLPANAVKRITLQQKRITTAEDTVKEHLASAAACVTSVSASLPPHPPRPPPQSQRRMHVATRKRATDKAYCSTRSPFVSKCIPLAVYFVDYIDDVVLNVPLDPEFVASLTGAASSFLEQHEDLVVTNLEAAAYRYPEL
eukprot:jgi/Tetstr1/445009/TSEL_032817.t1